MIGRRQLLERALVLAAAPVARVARAQAPPAAGSAFSPHARGTPQAFDYAMLKGIARKRAAARYEAPSTALPAALAGIGYDAFQAIRFVPHESLWAGSGAHFEIRFFHLGYRYREAVRMHEVSGGMAREIAYDPAMFDMQEAGIDTRELPRDLGFAGFRVHFHTNWDADVAAFLGASYFRAVGADRQYGLSARGLAIGVGDPAGEEFPRFTEFWFERAAATPDRITVYALLDSPSVAGAYRFDVAPGGTTTMDIDAALYPRRAIDRIGIAPLTSMYLCGENDRRVGSDWRPEIHDSDGLAMASGSGEWIWRPLVNAPGTRLNSFADRHPRGFGLLQRDRVFDHYLDDGAFYDRRPGAWVEPKPLAGGGFDAGAVQLLEYPAQDEATDNIVACWRPAAPVQPAGELLYAYRLYWGAAPPVRAALARVVATYTGIGGVVGQPRRHFAWRFVVDFVGGDLAALPMDATVEPVITASRGAVEIPSARPQREIDGYRAMFDIRPDDAPDPVDLRLYLRLDGAALSETWLYQWTPPPLVARQAYLAT
ncbi:MAG TPA: glucan biosynthesis protein D [Casimicrobiaceae bacterium]|nr:glucan biosynthesis protein D [Casimicrobiaceae bacterium]